MILNASISKNGTTPTGSLSISTNGTYDVTDYAGAVVSVPTGIIIPAGYAYYNGTLLPIVPEVSGYPYYFIRKNTTTDMYDAVYGTSEWYARSTSSLSSWSLTFTNQSTVLSRIYSMPIDGSSGWEAGASSANAYGTSNNRNVLFANEDILIQNTTNILFLKSDPVTY